MRLFIKIFIANFVALKKSKWKINHFFRMFLGQKGISKDFSIKNAI